MILLRLRPNHTIAGAQFLKRNLGKETLDYSGDMCHGLWLGPDDGDMTQRSCIIRDP